MKIRHHGDFHLGQMLIVKDDVVIIDFEGEPRRSLAERRRKAPAARDVAGLIRSIDYSATAALERALKSAPDEHGKIARALDDWRERSVAAVLAAYREFALDARLWPASGGRRRPAARFLSPGEGLLRDRVRAGAPARLAARAARRAGAHSGAFAGAVMMPLPPEAYAVIEGRHPDPFHYLGLHAEDDRQVVRVFLPDAADVTVRRRARPRQQPAAHPRGRPVRRPAPRRLAALSCARALRRRRGRDRGSLSVPAGAVGSRSLSARRGHASAALRQARRASARARGRRGVAFVVFAPNARRVSVVGDFNSLGRPAPCHAGARQRLLGNLRAGGPHRRQIQIRDHRAGRQHAAAQIGSGRVRGRAAAADRLDRGRPRMPCRSRRRRRKGSMRSARRSRSTRCISAPGGAVRTRAIAGSPIGSWPQELPAYVRDMGFTHVEFLPVSEHPFDGSWGYQPTGLFAPTSRFGTPGGFRRSWSTACHRAGLAVILDWVPGHFPDDPHGLGRFDGTALYEHADPQQGRHLDWNTLIYNFGRTEVANFLLANGAVLARPLRDRRAAGRCGRIDALSRLQPAGGRLDSQPASAAARTSRRSRSCAASTPRCSRASRRRPRRRRNRPPGRWCRGRSNGAGSASATNGTWAGCTTRSITFSKDPIYRKHHHGEILFGLHYAFSENFILPLSHDEVVHGKRSILGRMPGDEWQRFANLRAYYGFMFGHPGKKLLFMGNEFAQESEWSARPLARLASARRSRAHRRRAGAWCAISTGSIAALPALHELDCEAAGFEWLVMHDADRSVFAWLRKGRAPRAALPRGGQFHARGLPRLPHPGAVRRHLARGPQYRCGRYGGSNVGNAGAIRTLDEGSVPEVSLVIPPLAAIFLVPER